MRKYHSQFALSINATLKKTHNLSSTIATTNNKSTVLKALGRLLLFYFAEILLQSFL